MSYRFTMCFKKVSSDLEALRIMNEIRKALLNKENFEKFINDNLVFYIQQLTLLGIKRTNVDKVKNIKIIENLIETTTKNCFCYWADYKLLGFCSDTDYNFGFNKVIHFQNSVDQDYSYSKFEGLCDDIDKEIERAKKMSSKELSEALNNKCIESIDKNIDYNRRTYIYDFSYKLLDLENWLYKNNFEKENAFAFDMCVPVEHNHNELYQWFVDFMKKLNLSIKGRYFW